LCAQIGSVTPPLLQRYRFFAFHKERGILGCFEIIVPIEDEEIGVITHLLPRSAFISSIMTSAPRISAST
jgi:hypothetical protein